jgi:cell volume regulation protein A
VTTIAHGSGFLAVFVAGLLISDVRAPFKGEIENFHKSLASLAEIAVFAVLGLTTHLADLTPVSVWLDGLLIALLLAFLIRPLVVAPLLAPVRLRLGERLFVMWGGLKGAVPILLGILVLLEGVHGASRVYGIIFVVVAFSVVIQGSTMSYVARWLGVPMRSVVPTPWDVSIRFKEEPRTVRRYNVVKSSRALGRPISELPLGDRSWISMLIRNGEPEQPRGSTELRPGDEVLVLAEPGDEQKLSHLFEGRR